MASDVDLRQLAIDRSASGPARLRVRRHLATRYLLPLILVCGYLSLMAWAARDTVFPPRLVTVVPVLATVAEVRQEGAPLFQAAGWIEPRPTPVRVAALAPGVVEKLLVVEDQAVKAGEAVAELVKDDALLALERTLADQRLRSAEVDEAVAALAAATTRLNQPVHLEAALGDAEAALARLETQLRNLPFELRRAKADHDALQKDYEGKVSAKGAVSGIAIELAKGKRDVARALVEELESRFESLKPERQAHVQRRDALRTQLELLADEIKAKDEAAARLKAAQARVAQADVAVAEAKLQLDRMTIRAPLDGRVYRLVAHPGARVGGDKSPMSGSDGSTVITMYDPRRLQVRVDVRFEDIPKVRLQQPVAINNPVLAAPLAGSVLFISSEADIQKNTLEVKVELPDPSPWFKPEMLVDVTFLSPHHPDDASEPSQELKLYVPRPLVHQGDDGAFVWVAQQAAGRARRQLVETAAGTGDLVEVTRGLTVTSRIIAGGGDGLRDGERIRVAGEDRVAAARSVSTAGKSRRLSRLPQEEDR